MPLTFLATIAAFQLAILAAPAAAIQPWSLELGERTESVLSELLPAFELGSVRWRDAAREAAIVALSGALPSVIQRLLAFAAHEQATGEVLDMSKELACKGIAMIVGAPT